MILARLIVNTKMGKEEKAGELAKEFFSLIPPPHGLRIYSNRFGPFNKLIVDMEFENVAEQADWQEKWWSVAENSEVMKKWYEVLEPGGGNEIWNVVYEQ